MSAQVVERILCVACGCFRPVIDQTIDPQNGTVRSLRFAGSQIFWWYDRDLKLHSKAVNDGETEPEFSLIKDAPFHVVSADFGHIKTVSK